MLLDQMVKNRVHMPSWLPSNTICLVYAGSRAYGTNRQDSDYDVYGAAFPPFGELVGFPNGHFGQWHPKNAIEMNSKEYDITVYSVVKFFKLATENNPNIVDFMFVPQNCIIHSTPTWEMIRSNRKKFLHRGCWHRFKNYAASQLTKLNHKKYVNSKRIALVEQYGFDTKFASHVVRLMLECEQILTECDLDLQRHSNILKAIRNGEWSLEKINSWFEDKSKQVEKFYETSPLPVKPDCQELTEILLNALRTHYSSLPVVDNSMLIDELKLLVNKYGEK